MFGGVVMYEFWVVFFWWGLISSLGILVFPLSFWLFQRTWDGGWVLAKVLGVAFLSYWVWIVGSLRILPFTPFTIWIGIVLLLLLSSVVGVRFRRRVRAFFV